jgi:hypothetical protein
VKSCFLLETNKPEENFSTARNVYHDIGSSSTVVRGSIEHITSLVLTSWCLG